MYAEHFGLRGLPFQPTITPEDAYQSPELKEALSHFFYAIANREPLLLLTGEVGSGKTTAIQVALQSYREKLTMAVVSHATLTPRELLDAVEIGYGLDTGKNETKPRQIQRLEAHFTRCREAGRPALLVFDEAHLLKPAVLEEVRLLSNLTRQGEVLVQIFLVGQPELERRLQRRYRSLRQRISVRYRLKPLAPEETTSYIDHRLRAAGCSEPRDIFSEDAATAVYRLSGGLPREINVIAGFAMLSCYLENQHRVRRGHVQSVRAEYGFEGVTADPGSEDAPVPARRNEAETSSRDGAPGNLVSAEPEPNLEDRTFASLHDEAPAAREESPGKVEGESKEPHSPLPAEATHPSVPATGDFLDVERGETPRPSARTKVLALVGSGLAAVALVFWLWSGPVIPRGTSASNDPRTVVDSLHPAQAEQALTARQSPTPSSSGGKTEDLEVQDDTPAESVQSQPEVEPRERGEDSLRIRRDRALIDDPNRPVTVQIAALLDQEIAEDSLARASERTGLPGAIEIVPSGDTTWYLVLLGCFGSMEEAEARILTVLPILARQAVTEVRIKPAPAWLQDRLTRDTGEAKP